MTYGITSAKQANGEFEKARQKRFNDFLEEIQIKIDEAIKNEAEFFYKEIPKWCQEDAKNYLKEMGYEVIVDDKEINRYIIVFGERLKKELSEKRRKRQTKKRIQNTVFFTLLILVLIATFYMWVILNLRTLEVIFGPLFIIVAGAMLIFE